MPSIPQLPSTDQISDPQVRTFCDALMNAWQVRNGDVGKGGDRFVTYDELGGQVAGVLGGVFGVTPGQPGSSITTPVTGPVTGPGQTATIIRNLQDSIFQSELFRRLGEQIARVELPRYAVRFVQDAVRATAGQIEAIGARVGATEAAIVSERLVRADQTGAIAQAVNTMWAIMSGGAYNSEVGSIIQDGSLAAVSPIAATAQRFNTLQSYVIGPNDENLVASVRQDFNTYVNSTNGRLEAAYTLRIEIDNNGNRVVGGFGILGIADNATTRPRLDFGVRADRFFIASPNPSNPALFTQTAPFIVLTTTDAAGNPPGVYINNAFIGFASITTAQIATASIDTLRIAGNAVTVSTYDSSSLFDGTLTSTEETQCLTTVVISGLEPGETAGTIFSAFSTLYEKGSPDATIRLWIYLNGNALAVSACTLGDSKTLSCLGYYDLPNGTHVVETRIAVDPSTGPGSSDLISFGNLVTMSGKR